MAHVDTCIRRALRWIVFASALVPVLAWAASYVYDANGRLRAVTSSTGASSEYIYDALGNLYAVDAIPASQLAIFAFTPNHGGVGTTVTVFGQGFSTTPGNNVLKFNGTAATVSSSTATQLVATVPTGATTGPISVQVGTSTATSLDNFLVTTDSGGQSPVVTSFTPALAVPGTTITVTGSHFVSAAGATSAGVNSATSVVTPTSDSQLSFTVPTGSGSGLVTVITPYGIGQSTQALIVLPNAIGSVSNVLASGTLTIGGSAQTLNITTADKYGVLTFQGDAGQWISLQCPQMNAGNDVYASLYDENGVTIMSSTVAFASTRLSWHLPQLPRTGTYLLALQPNLAFQFSVSAELNPFLTTASPLSVATTVPYQSKRIIFNGTYGQYSGINVSGITTSPSGGTLYGVVGNTDYPEGWDFDQVSGSSAFTVYAPPEPTSLDNTLVLDTRVNSTYSAQIALVNYPSGSPNGSISVDGSATTVTTGAPSEYGTVQFNATAGQSVSMGIANLTVSPGSAIQFSIYQPDGSVWNKNGTVFCYVPGCHYLLTNIVESGSYRVWFYPPGVGGTFSFNAVVSNDVTGALVPNTAQAVNLTKAGQAGRLTFSGVTGQYVGISLRSVATTPSGGTVTMTVFNPDGSAVYDGSAQTTSTTFLNLQQLTQTGTYTVQLESQYADTSSMQVTMVSNTTATLTADGTATSVGTTVGGEDMYLTFNGTSGQQLSLGFSNITTSPTNQNFTYSVYQPNGTYVSNGLVGVTCTTAGCHAAFPVLPATGVYTIVIQPTPSATLAVTATLSSDVTGALTSNTADAVTLARAGQVARLTFTGAIGDHWALNLSNVATTPSGGTMSLLIYNPDGTSGVTISNTSAATLNIPTLTQAGTYTVQVEAQNADTGSAQVILIPNPNNTLVIDGSSVNEQPTYAGEAVYLSFNGTAGQNISVVLATFASTPSGGESNYTVYKPAGTQLTSGVCYVPGCHSPLTNLPTTGLYTITVNAPSSTTNMSFTASLVSDATGALTPNVASSINLAKAGQCGLWTFSGTAGSTGGLYIASIAGTPSGQTMKFSTFNPDGTALSGGAGSGSVNTSLNLPVLTQTGTYSVLVEPQYAGTDTAQLTFLTPTALTINGSSSSVPTTGAGQNVYLTFSGTAAQNVTVAFSSFIRTPSGSSFIAAYQPNGSRVNYVSCSTATCSLVLSNLPVTGNYEVIVGTPGSSSTMRFIAKVTSP